VSRSGKREKIAMADRRRERKRRRKNSRRGAEIILRAVVLNPTPFTPATC